MKKAWGFVVSLSGETEGTHAPLCLGHVCGHPSCLQLEEEAGLVEPRPWSAADPDEVATVGSSREAVSAGPAPWPSRAALLWGRPAPEPFQQRFIRLGSQAEIPHCSRTLEAGTASPQGKRDLSC